MKKKKHKQKESHLGCFFLFIIGTHRYGTEQSKQKHFDVKFDFMEAAGFAQHAMSAGGFAYQVATT